MTTSNTDNTEKEDFNSIYMEFVKETDLIKKFNLFLKLHCKEDYAHLIDSDDNAGEFMRKAIDRQINSLMISRKEVEEVLQALQQPVYSEEAEGVDGYIVYVHEIRTKLNLKPLKEKT